MAERRTIGQILMSSGRITEDDAARALEYQEENGGYFGEALMELGLVSREELEWSLASQFDLPYIFPDADSVDPEAAALVSPEWALAHLTMPIMKAGNTLSVVVDSPIKTDAVDELAKRTNLTIELALASPSHIRELIRQVYARGAAREELERRSPCSIVEGFGLALDAASSRFGISTRGVRSGFWYDDGGTVRRRPLEGEWRIRLDDLLSPSPIRQVGDQVRAVFTAEINRQGIVSGVDVRYMADESGHEFLFKPVEGEIVLHERFDAPPAGITTEIQMLARSGSARFIVSTDPPELGHDILPHLPSLTLDPSWRSIYINALDQDAASKAFSLQMPMDPEQWSSELDTLRAFHFDVVTVDLTGNAEDWAASALDVASVAFLLWGRDEDRHTAYDAGVRWELRLSRTAEGELLWSLEPLSL